jgi:transcriptional regulator with XRE-family HTH domain
MTSGVSSGASRRHRGVPIMETELPSTLPQTPAGFQTLAQWRELKLGMSQAQVATAAGVKQARISQIERGHLPRKKHWPDLMRGYQLQGQEADFYRMIMTAHREQKARVAREFALQQPVSETEPLFENIRSDEPQAEDSARRLA